MLHTYGIYYVEINRKSTYNKGKYDHKTVYITNAIKAIAGTKNSKFSFYCIEDKDQNGYSSYITYFDSQWGQVSFHTPIRAGKILRPWVGKGTPTKWVGPKQSSLEICQKLKKIFNL